MQRSWSVICVPVAKTAVVAKAVTSGRSPAARACRLSLSASLGAADLLQLDQLALEVGLQMGAMATLEGSQLFDILLQQATFTTELLKKL